MPSSPSPTVGVGHSPGQEDGKISFEKKNNDNKQKVGTDIHQKSHTGTDPWQHSKQRRSEVLTIPSHKKALLST